MAANVRDRDLGWKRIKNELEKLSKKPEIKIGLLSDTSREKKETIVNDKKIISEEITVLEVAIHNEYGAPKANIPERSFIRSTYDQKNKDWFKLIEKMIDRVYTGKSTVEDGMNIVGLRAEADIKLKLKNGDSAWQPNAPSTIKQKGSTKPLINTTQMLNSIAFEIKMKGSK